MAETLTVKAGGTTVTVATRGALLSQSKEPVVSLALTFGILTQSHDLPVKEARRLAVMLHNAATDAELQREGVMQVRGLG